MNDYVIKSSEPIELRDATPWIESNEFFFCRVRGYQPESVEILADGNEPYTLEDEQVIGVFA